MSWMHCTQNGVYNVDKPGLTNSTGMDLPVIKHSSSFKSIDGDVYIESRITEKIRREVQIVILIIRV